MATNVFSAREIKRNWQLIDAKDQTLGRISTQIARILMGKTKPSYVPYLDQGDFVVVTNAAEVKVTGKKANQKIYTRHSGYPGGLRQENFNALQNRRPTEIIRHAVRGMLPKTKLGDKMIKKLYIYPDASHPHRNLKKEEGK